MPSNWKTVEWVKRVNYKILVGQKAKQTIKGIVWMPVEYNRPSYRQEKNWRKTGQRDALTGKRAFYQDKSSTSCIHLIKRKRDHFLHDIRFVHAHSMVYIHRNTNNQEIKKWSDDFECLISSELMTTSHQNLPYFSGFLVILHPPLLCSWPFHI